MVRFVRVQLVAATSPFPLLAASGTVTQGEHPGAKTRVRGINLAAGTGAWAIGFQAWEGTWENPAATTKPRWAASSFGFTGREHELDSGLVYARDRYVNPVTGVWTQVDRFVQAHDRTWDVTNLANLHLYGYVGQSPTAFTDPLGQIRIPTTIEAFIFRMIVRGAYREAIIAMQGLGMNAMMRGQAVQQALARWTASGAARLYPATGGAGYRVADFLDKENNLLVELKFMEACNFSISRQIADMARWAQSNGYRMVLVIRNSELMKPRVAERLRELGVQVIELKDWALDLVETVPLGGA